MCPHVMLYSDGERVRPLGLSDRVLEEGRKVRHVSGDFVCDFYVRCVGYRQCGGGHSRGGTHRMCLVSFTSGGMCRCVTVG